MAKSHIRLGRKDILRHRGELLRTFAESLGEAYRSLTGRGDRHRTVLHLLQCEQTSGCHFPNGPGLLIIGHDNSSLGGIADGVAINVTYVAYLTVTDSTAIRSVGLDTLNRGVAVHDETIIADKPDNTADVVVARLDTLDPTVAVDDIVPLPPHRPHHHSSRISSRQRQGSFRRGWRSSR